MIKNLIKSKASALGKHTINHETEAILWADFAQKNNLSTEQLYQFQTYYTLLKNTNDLHNLTAITDLEAVLTDHFDDSLALGNFINIETISRLADIGTGAGFPGIALKIKYPHCALILIEVTHKKIQFLQKVIQELGLSDVIIYDFDWRTFLRKTNYAIDLFCARASLQPTELLRIFKPSSSYKNAQLVYWASKNWQPLALEQSYITKQEQYTISEKYRKLIFFAQLQSS